MFHSNKSPFFAALIAVVAVVATPMLGSANATAIAVCKQNGSGPEINACALDAANSADRAINRSVRKISKGMKKQDKINFLVEHQTWLDSRYVECRALLREDEGYTIWPSEFNNCLADLTLARNIQLRKQFSSRP